MSTKDIDRMNMEIHKGGIIYAYIQLKSVITKVTKEPHSTGLHQKVIQNSTRSPNKYTPVVQTKHGKTSLSRTQERKDQNEVETQVVREYKQ